MVKKITGGVGPAGVGGAKSVDGVRSVEETKATEVAGVSGARSKGGVQGVRREGRAITAGDREMLYQLIHEEADKLFGDTGIAEKKRKTVEGAVKITIDASIPEDDSNPSKGNPPAKSRS